MRIRMFMTGLMVFSKNRNPHFEGDWTAALVDTEARRASVRHTPVAIWADGNTKLKGDLQVVTDKGPIQSTPSQAGAKVPPERRKPRNPTEARALKWLVKPGRYSGGKLQEDLSASSNKHVVASICLRGRSMATARLAVQCDYDTPVTLRFGSVRRVATEVVVVEATVRDATWAQIVDHRGNPQTDEIPPNSDGVVDLWVMNSRPAIDDDDRLKTERKEARHWPMLADLYEAQSKELQKPGEPKPAQCPQPSIELPDFVSIRGWPSRPICIPGGG